MRSPAYAPTGRLHDVQWSLMDERCDPMRLPTREQQIGEKIPEQRMLQGGLRAPFLPAPFAQKSALGCARLDRPG